MALKEWHALVREWFVAHECEVVVAERGWGETIVKRGSFSNWRAARLLGGTLAAVCKKAGAPGRGRSVEKFETFLRCPNCHGSLERDGLVLRCACGYEAREEDGVYNLLPSEERKELYPGDREDIVEFLQAGHEWHRVERR